MAYPTDVIGVGTTVGLVGNRETPNKELEIKMEHFNFKPNAESASTRTNLASVGRAAADTAAKTRFLRLIV